MSRISVLLDKSAPSFTEQINTKEFISIAFLWLVGVVAILANVNSNTNIIKFQQMYSNGISQLAFAICFIIWGILGAFMVYIPYIEDKKNGKHVILLATIYYILAMVFWAFTLFHVEVQGGASGLALILVLAANLWLAWACYHFNKLTLIIYVVQFLFTIYLINYSYEIGQVQWTTTQFNIGTMFNPIL